MSVSLRGCTINKRNASNIRNPHKLLDTVSLGMHSYSSAYASATDYVIPVFFLFMYVEECVCVCVCVCVCDYVFIALCCVTCVQEREKKENRHNNVMCTNTTCGRRTLLCICPDCAMRRMIDSTCAAFCGLTSAMLFTAGFAKGG